MHYYIAGMTYSAKNGWVLNKKYHLISNDETLRGYLYECRLVDVPKGMLLLVCFCLTNNGSRLFLMQKDGTIIEKDVDYFEAPCALGRFIEIDAPHSI